MNVTPVEILRTIEASDPDGKSEEPTEAKHLAHREWAIKQFGVQAWKDYSKGGWDDNNGI